jgi:starch synthase
MDPLVKVGGLGDVMWGLPKKLKDNDCNIRIVLPNYRIVKDHLEEFNIKTLEKEKDIKINILGLTFDFKISQVEINGIRIILIDNEYFFDREHVYCTPQGDYEDNYLRYGAFCIAALESVRILKFKPDIIHCHDWHTAFIPIFLKNSTNLIKNYAFFENSKIVYSIHNIAYQGVYDMHLFNIFNFASYLYSPFGLEYYGKINIMKGGIIYSDLVTTVSPTYSKEIKTPLIGKGMEGVISDISEKRNNLVGILNGIDYDKWNPETDDYLYHKYNVNDLKNKLKNKFELKAQFNLITGKDKPLIGMVCRLAEQKGIDLVIESLERIIKLGYQLIIIGSGEQRYIDMLNAQNKKHEGNFCALVKYNDKIARRIYAGSDIFLMPSRFEPCGLGQIIALRYGTIPVARTTGGLIDTIIDYSLHKDNGFGFLFNEFTIADLVSCLRKVLKIYKNSEQWLTIVKRAMKVRYSWDDTSKIYIHEYKKLMEL